MVGLAFFGQLYSMLSITYGAPGLQPLAGMPRIRQPPVGLHRLVMGCRDTNVRGQASLSDADIESDIAQGLEFDERLFQQI
jgi:hypothetical protein